MFLLKGRGCRIYINVRLLLCRKYERTALSSVKKKTVDFDFQEEVIFQCVAQNDLKKTILQRCEHLTLL